MTDEQAHMLKALTRCTFQPGSSPKDFVYQLDAIMRDPEPDPGDGELTPRQDWYLRRLYYMYRGQIGHSQPKPADFDNPPPRKPRTKAQQELAEREARGEIIVCRAPAPHSDAADELERLRAWNEGKPR